MWKFYGILITRRGYRPQVIAQSQAAYILLTRLKRLAVIIDVVGAIIGIISAILGYNFSFPIILGAIALFAFIQVGKFVTYSPDIYRNCPDCGLGLGERNPDLCYNCGWQSPNPINPDRDEDA